MQPRETQIFSSVYGPVRSWRYGRSLGIDPIGKISTCSFNCVYCQLGEIERLSSDRQIFVPTEQIQHDLQAFAPWDVDVITLSGSGEPTLALNLGAILTMVKKVTGKSVGVLTNGSLLNNPVVRAELTIADQVAVKVDAIRADQLRRINRPLMEIDLPEFWTGLQQFRAVYRGHLAIQTMLLSPWNDRDQILYMEIMQRLQPDEIQLNTPTRPKPLTHEIEARGNPSPNALPYTARWLKRVSADYLQEFGDRIQTQIEIPVRSPNQTPRAT